MNKSNKQLSNPFSTGGGGTFFETNVQAYFVTLMLTGGYAPCMPYLPIKKIKLQGKYAGYETDDAIIFGEGQDGRKGNLLCQIKHSINITRNNSIFQQVIQAAWKDTNNPTIFDSLNDNIAVITGPLSKSDIDDVRTILEWARDSEDAEDFFRKVYRAKYSSQKKIEKTEAFKHNLSNANRGDISNDQLWKFMKRFYLLGFDFDVRSSTLLSLFYSMIGQYSIDNIPGIWTQIVREVQLSNLNSGTITPESLPTEIRSVFQKPRKEIIPVDLEVQSEDSAIVTWNEFEFADELAIANLIGGWNEHSNNDTGVIEKLSGTEYSDWISKIRKILQSPESPLSMKNGIWTVIKRREMWQGLGARLFDDHLDKFYNCATDVLMELDPQFELSSDERFMANIRGKVLSHSPSLRTGLAESLALMACETDALNNCSTNKAHSVVGNVIHQIFSGSDWVRWATLNNLLPILAEASPEEFLSAVEITIQEKPCPFDEIFAQENTGVFGNNYMTGLLWALETLAWDERYLVQVTILLGNLAAHDPGGNWGNRPANSLRTIFLPWMPQTIAPLTNRKTAIQVLQREIPSIAWKLLLDLFPNQHMVTMGSHKPAWRKIIPDGWEKVVLKKDYWEQVTFYSELAIEMAKADFLRLKEIVSKIGKLPNELICKLISYLNTPEIIHSSEEKRTLLWQELTKMISKHRKFKEAKWALPSETLQTIEMVANEIAPHNPQNNYARIFINNDFELYDDKLKYEEEGKILEKKRQDAIHEIYMKGKIESVLEFAQRVESSQKVGYSLAHIADNNIDLNILPSLIETKDHRLTLFVSGYIGGRFSSQGWNWIKQLDTTKWTQSQIGRLLSCLPFTNNTWEYSDALLGKHDSEYWNIACAYPHQCDGDITYAVDKLIENDRPYAAISCLFKNLFDKKPIDNARAIKALLKTSTSNESVDQMTGYYMIEIIKVLQNDPDFDQDDLLKIEWAYLPLLTGPGRDASPKCLEKRLATDSKFFCEVIRTLYRPKNKPEAVGESSEFKKQMAENAWKLLNDWKTIPGLESEGTFSVDKFKKWYDDVRIECEESGHLDIAQYTIGEVFIHFIPDPSGLWIHRSIAEILNAEDSDEMRKGFRIGIINSRGCHWIDPTGKPERELSCKYNQQADEVENAGYYRLARTLRAIAEVYNHEANRIIDEHDE